MKPYQDVFSSMFKFAVRIILNTLLSASILGLSFSISHAHDAVMFKDIAIGDGAGISYRRTPSPREAIWDAMRRQEVVTLEDFTQRKPLKSRGAPGVAVFDYDRDGDLDIYVTNGPGTANSLYSNQFRQTGEVTFTDVSTAAGVALTDYDNTGVCYGDIDNDGDQDLMVLTLGGPNRLLENLGNGTFVDITDSSNVSGGNGFSTSCSMGDVNGDAKLDIAVSNTYTNWNDDLPINVFGNEHRHEHNQLLINLGSNVFEDMSEESGIRNFAGISWAIALVDYDIDGDVDLIVGDDQGGKAAAIRGGKDLGYIRIYKNDGTGHFTDVTGSSGMDRAGAWMGLAFGDFNSDGNMDIFASNIGDYAARFLAPTAGFEVVPGDWLSGWFLAKGDGTFKFPGVGELIATPFGWGNAAVDYDNDSDTDIVYQGGMDFGPFTEAANAGSVLQNDGAANFGRDTTALSRSTNHARRTVQGVAAGDLNDDGFMDIVSVSNHDWPSPLPLVPILPPELMFGGPFDSTAFIWPTFSPIDPANPFSGFIWNRLDPANGTLSVEINGAENHNNWVKVSVLGTAGLLDEGRVNRDGIGAVVKFMPKNKKPVMVPILGGASYSSQHSLEAVFGLGEEKIGMIEINWPGGVRNRLYGVQAQERITFPEIPCSYDDARLTLRDYTQCVRGALDGLHQQGVLERKQRGRFLSSSIRAYRDAHKHHDDGKSELDEEHVDHADD